MTEPAPEPATLDPIGIDGWLVGFGEALTEPANRAAPALRAAVEAAGLPGLVETAAALNSVLVRFDPGVTDHAATRAAVAALLAMRDWRAGPGVTVQDAGRPGWRAQGLSCGGGRPTPLRQPRGRRCRGRSRLPPSRSRGALPMSPSTPPPALP